MDSSGALPYPSDAVPACDSMNDGSSDLFRMGVEATRFARFVAMVPAAEDETVGGLTLCSRFVAPLIRACATRGFFELRDTTPARMSASVKRAVLLAEE